jgi:hypothetical protein
MLNGRLSVCLLKESSDRQGVLEEIQSYGSVWGLSLDSHVMIENPYQSPQFWGETVNAEPSLRKRARRAFRVATLVLLIPAVYNYWAFDAHAIASSGLPSELASVYRTIDILGFVVGGTLIWLLGVPILEAIARLLRVLFANGTDRAAWQDILYRSLNWAAFLAIPGAALWAIWVFGFYQMKVDFYAISWAVGVPAHLLAACWYLPLIRGWYRLATSRATRLMPQNESLNRSGD